MEVSAKNLIYLYKTNCLKENIWGEGENFVLEAEIKHKKKGEKKEENQEILQEKKEEEDKKKNENVWEEILNLKKNKIPEKVPSNLEEKILDKSEENLNISEFFKVIFNFFF